MTNKRMANHSATHPKHVHHHFVDSNQQFEPLLGMGILVNEILFFGGLFGAYIVFRTGIPNSLPKQPSSFYLLGRGQYRSTDR